MTDKEKAAISIAESMLKTNGLTDWSVGVNARRNTLAETWHEEKKIMFSKYFIALATKEQFTGVSLHEIAHALLGPGFGHGDEFVETCMNMGLHPEYTSGDVKVSINRYRFTCPSCGFTGTHNAGCDKACVRCSVDGATVVMIKTKNTIIVKEW